MNEFQKNSIAHQSQRMLALGEESRRSISELIEKAQFIARQYPEFKIDPNSIQTREDALAFAEWVKRCLH